MRKRLLALVLALCLVVSMAVPGYAAQIMPSEMDIYLTMSAFRSTHPEGTPWTNENSYTWKGSVGVVEIGYGCAAFAYMLSDAVFGELPARQITEFSYDDIRPGDVLRVNGDTHSVIVLQVTPLGAVIAEGNYMGTVHWDRRMSKAEVEAADYVLSRYPLEYTHAEQTVYTEDTQAYNHMTLLKKSFPEGMHWGYDYNYFWKGGNGEFLDEGYGSYAFAFMLSDAIFGDLPARTLEVDEISDLRSGDLIMTNYGSVFLVRERLGTAVSLVYGEDGAEVTWDYQVKAENLENFIYMALTRYPAEDPGQGSTDPSEPGTDDPSTGTGEEVGGLEKDARDAMNALRETYPEGTPWGGNDSYTWNGSNLTGYGCAAFAMILSDGAFGELPAREVTDFTVEDIRTGDILEMDGYTVIVLEDHDDYVVVAEGEYNGGIHWDRVISAEEIQAADCTLTTRYPEGTEEDPESEEGKPVYSGNVIAEGNCGRPVNGVFQPNVKWLVTDQNEMVFYGEGTAYHNTLWNNYTADIESFRVEKGVDGFFSTSFADCDNIKTVYLPVGFQTMPNYFFKSCDGLTEIRLPEGLSYLGVEAFRGCANLTTVHIPSTASIYDGAFQDCDKLTNVNIAYGVRSISRDAFSWCDALTHIDLPDSLEYIGDSAFRDSALESVVIPDSVTEIGDYAFSDNGNLKSVHIPAGVTEWGDAVFAYNEALENVTFAEGITTLGAQIFGGCGALRNMRLPDTLTAIPPNMFLDSGVIAVEIPQSVTQVGAGAFSSCYELRYLGIPATLTEIPQGAFSGTGEDIWDGGQLLVVYGGTEAQWEALSAGHIGLEYAEVLFLTAGDPCPHPYVVEIPAVEATCQGAGLTSGERCARCGVDTVAQQATEKADHYYFANAKYTGVCAWCGQKDDRPDDTVILLDTCGGNTFFRIYRNGHMEIFGEGDMTEDMYLYRPWQVYSDHITSVEILPGVTSISANAFTGMPNLKTAVLPDTVRSVGNSAFRASGLEQVNLPEGLEHLGDYAFHQTRLREVVLPASLTSMGQECFSCNPMLRSAVIPNVSTMVLGFATFRYCTNLVDVQIGEKVTQLEGSNFENTRYLRSIMDENGCCVINGVLLEYLGRGTQVHVPEGVTRVADAAFGRKHVENVYLPSTLLGIDNSAFARSTGLKRLVIPANVEYIEAFFLYNSEVEEVVFLGDVPEIDKQAFQGATVTAYYPYGNSTWTSSVRKNYGGSITWVESQPCQHENVKTVPGVPATCEQTGTGESTVCLDCGAAVSEAAVLPKLPHDFQNGKCSMCAAEETEAALLGDVNGDGKVSNVDAMLALQFFAGIVDETTVDTSAGDVNGDGKITNVDAMLILQYFAGIITQFPKE